MTTIAAGTWIMLTQLAVEPSAEESFGGLETAGDVFQLKYFNSGLLIRPLPLAIALGVLLVVVVGLLLLRRRRTRHERSTPMTVFHRVVRELGLSLPDEWLLCRIAHQRALPTPLTLVLSRATLEHHAHAYAGTLSRRGSRKVLARTGSIAAALFRQQTPKTGAA